MWVHAISCAVAPAVHLLALEVYGTAFSTKDTIQIVISFLFVNLMVFLGARRRDVDNRNFFLDTRWQHRRAEEISELLRAVFDACFLIDSETSVVLESSPKLNHIFQQDMCGKPLRGAVASHSDTCRFDTYLANLQEHGAQLIELQFMGAHGLFEVSVIATRLASVETHRQLHQTRGLLVGLQLPTGIGIQLTAKSNTLQFSKRKRGKSNSN